MLYGRISVALSNFPAKVAKGEEAYARWELEYLEEFKKELDSNARPIVDQQIYLTAKQKVLGSHGFVDEASGEQRDVKTLTRGEQKQWNARVKENELTESRLVRSALRRLGRSHNKINLRVSKVSAKAVLTH
jgi:hypothetical protein